MNKAMKVLLAAALAVMTAGAALAQNTSVMCAYVNDDADGTNSVEGYVVGHGNMVGAHLGPIATNGMGTGGGFFVGGEAALRIWNNDLYVSDGGSTPVNITHFNLNTRDCTLSKDNALYPSGDTTTGYGDDLATDGQSLFVGTAGNFSLYSIPINAGGTLGAPVFQQSTSDFPDGFEVSPDGKTLVVGYPDIQQVCAYKITEPGGILGSPNCQSVDGGPTGVSIDPTSTCVYSGVIYGDGLTEIAAFKLTGGVLGSPMSYPDFGTSTDSQSVLVNWSGKSLYISNVNAAQVTQGTITSGCKLSNPVVINTGGVAGTDFVGQLAQAPRAHGYLVAGAYNIGTPSMTVFQALTTGLVPIGSGQFPLLTGSGPLSVVAYGRRQ